MIVQTFEEEKKHDIYCDS